MSPTPGPCIRVQNIPRELRVLPRWVRFDVTHDFKGCQKTPRVPGTMREASNRTPSDWRPFPAALADAQVQGQYVGFVVDVTLPYVFLDLDDVLGPNAAIREDAAVLVDTLDTYSEISASGTGLHLICRGILPKHFSLSPVPPGCKPIEIYPRRGPRFCIFTGDTRPSLGSLDGLIEERTTVLATLFPERPSRPTAARLGSPARRPSGELEADDVATIVAWAGPLWTDGRRHHLALYLSGALASAGVSRVQAAGIVERSAASDRDPATKLHACHDTYDAWEAGEVVSGWSGLREVCGLSEDDLAPLSVVLKRLRCDVGLGRARAGSMRIA